MNIISLSGIAILAAIISVLMRKNNPEISIIISLAAGVIILYIVIDQIAPIIKEIIDMASNVGISYDYLSILFKALGICFLTQFASDSCRDAGEGAIGSKIELAGKVAIVVISLPLFKQILVTVTSLLGGS